MQYIVFYRRRSGRQDLRIGTHSKPDSISEREFRVSLISEYNRTKKQVERIKRSICTLEGWMENQERIELMEQLKAEIVEAMRQEEPDYGEEIHLETQEILVRAIERIIDDTVYDLKSA